MDLVFLAVVIIFFQKGSNAGDAWEFDYESWGLQLFLTARAAATYHEAAAIAPGSGTEARISPDTYVERPACNTLPPT